MSGRVPKDRKIVRRAKTIRERAPELLRRSRAVTTKEIVETG
jgi:hypothetical protein